MAYIGMGSGGPAGSGKLMTMGEGGPTGAAGCTAWERLEAFSPLLPAQIDRQTGTQRGHSSCLSPGPLLPASAVPVSAPPCL